MTVSATGRTRQPPEKRLADILGAAREVFREKGYDDTSITEIAARAGLVEGSIYRFFESKRHLLIRVVELWYEEVLADYDQQLAGVRGVWNRLRFMVWHHLKSIHENPELVSLFFRHIRVSPDYVNSTVYDLNRRYTNHIVEIVQSGTAGGRIDGVANCVGSVLLKSAHTTSVAEVCWCGYPAGSFTTHTHMCAPPASHSLNKWFHSTS